MKVTRNLKVKRVVQIFLALAVFASLTGCSTSYMVNRRRDATDIVTIGVGVGFGAKARIGPLQTGLLSEFDVVALRGGAAGVSPWLTGCGDQQFLVGGDESFGLDPIGLPIQEFDYPIQVSGYNVFDERGKSFEAGNYILPFWSTLEEGVNAPYYYTQIELVGAFLGSVRIGVNPGEFVDFVLGWTTIDIFSDDIHIDGDYEYVVAYGQAKIIDFNETYSGALSITSTLGGRPVTCIGKSAFYGCTNLTGVTIGTRVTRIGDSAFYGCANLADVAIPNGVVSIGSEAFWGCSKLTNVTIPASVTSIGSDSFAYCIRLNSLTVDALNPTYSSSVDGVMFNKEKTEFIRYPGGKAGEYAIPASVNQIGRGAFGGSAGLTSVTIPDGVTAIESGTFENCTNLTSITIPGGVAKIETCTFQGCSALSNVTLRNGVTSLGHAAFAGCSSLTEITIPASVTEIGACAFRTCPELNQVSFDGDAPSGVTDTSIFGDGSPNVTVYYRPGTKGWGKTFGGRPTAVWKQ